MAYSPLRLRSRAPWLLLLLGAAACAPAYVAADGDTDGSGGSDADGVGGTDGEDGSGGSPDDGTGGEHASGGSTGESGGTSSSGGVAGGSDDGTGGVDASCDQSDTCIVAANFDDQCFSPNCSSPVAATESEVERNPCLVPWAERESEIPEECAAFDSVVACPAICAVQNSCIDAVCSESTGECGIVVCLP